MVEREKKLTRLNIDSIIERYLSEVEQLAGCVKEKEALPLLRALKRDQLKVGPYPKVSLFEAANRIMSDLVILYGVKWLLGNETFPFSAYAVEYGHGNKQKFDVMAEGNGEQLIGEAFNVAESFFQTKKLNMLNKLEDEGAGADYKILLFNHDAIGDAQELKPNAGYHYVVVHVGQGTGSILPPRPRQ